MVSGLAITLSGEPGPREAALQALARAPGLTLGPVQGSRVAATLETRDVDQAEVGWDQVLAVPGVLHLDLVCWFDDSGPGDAP